MLTFRPLETMFALAWASWSNSQPDSFSNCLLLTCQRDPFQPISVHTASLLQLLWIESNMAETVSGSCSSLFRIYDKNVRMCENLSRFTDRSGLVLCSSCICSIYCAPHILKIKSGTHDKLMHKKPDVSKLHMHVYRQKCRLYIIPPPPLPKKPSFFLFHC